MCFVGCSKPGWSEESWIILLRQEFVLTGEEGWGALDFVLKQLYALGEQMNYGREKNEFGGEKRSWAFFYISFYFSQEQLKPLRRLLHILSLFVFFWEAGG